MWILFAALAEAADPAQALPDWLGTVGLGQQAYVELMRQSFADPDHAVLWDARAGAALWTSGDYALAVRHFTALGDAPYAKVGLAYSLYRQRSYKPAAQVLDGVGGVGGPGGVDAPTAYYLSGLCHLRVGEDRAAVAAFSKVDDPVLGPAAHDLALGIPELHRLRWRVPAFAGVLSALLPGAGQAYDGRWGEASSALLVNAVLIGSGVELAHRQLWFGLGLVSLFEFSFYGGNIMSAVGGARRFDRTEPDRRAKAILEGKELTLVPDETGLVPQPPTAP